MADVAVAAGRGAAIFSPKRGQGLAALRCGAHAVGVYRETRRGLTTTNNGGPSGPRRAVAMLTTPNEVVRVVGPFIGHDALFIASSTAGVEAEEEPESPSRRRGARGEGSKAKREVGSWVVRQWDVRSGRAVHEYRGHRGPIVHDASSDEGGLLVTGGADRRVKVWSTRSGRCLRVFFAHTERVTAVRLGPGVVLSGSSDQTALAFAMADLDKDAGGEAPPLATYMGHTRAVTSIEAVEQRRLVVTASDDSTVRIFEAGSAVCLHVYTGHSDAVITLAVSYDQTRVCSASLDGSVAVIDLNSGATDFTLHVGSAAVHAVAFSRSSQKSVPERMVLCTEDGTIAIHDTETYAHRNMLQSEGPVDSFAVLGNLVFAASEVVLPTPTMNSGASRAELTADARRKESRRSLSRESLKGATSMPPRHSGSGRLPKTPKGGERRSATGHGMGTFDVGDERRVRLSRRGSWNISRDDSLSDDGDGTGSGPRIRNSISIADGDDETAGVGAQVWDLRLTLTKSGQGVAWTPGAICAVRRGRLWWTARGSDIVRHWRLATGTSEPHIAAVSLSKWTEAPRDPNQRGRQVGHPRGIVQVVTASSCGPAPLAIGRGAAWLWSPSVTRGPRRVESEASESVDAAAPSLDAAAIAGNELRWHQGPVRSLFVWTPSHRSLVSRFSAGGAGSGSDSGMSESDRSVGIGSKMSERDQNRPLMFTGGVDGVALCWDAESFQCVRSFYGHSGAVTCMAVSSTCTRLFTGSTDTTIRVWATSDGRCLRTFSGHSDRIQSIVLHPRAHRFWSGSHDNKVIYWNVRKAEAIRVFSGHERDVTSIAISKVPESAPEAEKAALPDGELPIRLYTASKDRSVRAWNSRTTRRHGIYDGKHKGMVLCMALSPDGEWLYTGASDTTIRMWSVRTHGSVAVYKGHTSRVNTLAVSDDGERLYSGSDEDIRLWSARAPPGHETSKEVSVRGSARVAVGATRSIAMLPDGRVAVGGLWGVVVVDFADVDIASGVENEEVEADVEIVGGVMSIVHSVSDGRLVVSRGGWLSMWDGGDLSDSAGGGAAAAAGDRPGTRPWAWHALGHSDLIRSVDTDASATTVATGSLDHTVRLWSAASGECLNVLMGHARSVHSVAFARVARESKKPLVFSSSSDKTVRAWEQETGDRVARLKLQTDEPAELKASRGLIVVGQPGCDVMLVDGLTCDLIGHLDAQPSLLATSCGILATVQENDNAVTLWDPFWKRRSLAVAKIRGPITGISVVDARELHERSAGCCSKQPRGAEAFLVWSALQVAAIRVEPLRSSGTVELIDLTPAGAPLADEAVDRAALSASARCAVRTSALRNHFGAGVEALALVVEFAQIAALSFRAEMSADWADLSFLRTIAGVTPPSMELSLAAASCSVLFLVLMASNFVSAVESRRSRRPEQALASAVRQIYRCLAFLICRPLLLPVLVHLAMLWNCEADATGNSSLRMDNSILCLETSQLALGGVAAVVGICLCGVVARLLMVGGNVEAFHNPNGSLARFWRIDKLQRPLIPQHPFSPAVVGYYWCFPVGVALVKFTLSVSAAVVEDTSSTVAGCLLGVCALVLWYMASNYDSFHRGNANKLPRSLAAAVSALALCSAAAELVAEYAATSIPVWVGAVALLVGGLFGAIQSGECSTLLLRTPCCRHRVRHSHVSTGLTGRCCSASADSAFTVDEEGARKYVDKKVVRNSYTVDMKPARSSIRSSRRSSVGSTARVLATASHMSRKSYSRKSTAGTPKARGRKSTASMSGRRSSAAKRKSRSSRAQRFDDIGADGTTLEQDIGAQYVEESDDIDGSRRANGGAGRLQVSVPAGLEALDDLNDTDDDILKKVMSGDKARAAGLKLPALATKQELQERRADVERRKSKKAMKKARKSRLRKSQAGGDDDVGVAGGEHYARAARQSKARTKRASVAMSVQ